MRRHWVRTANDHVTAMRDVAIAGFMFGSLPVILFRPWIGVLMFAWISLMTPHRFAYDFPFAAVVAVCTLVGLLVTKDEVRYEPNLVLVLLLLLPAWTCVTFVYLRAVTTSAWIRYGLLASMVLSGIAVLGTYSRGGLLAVCAMLLFLWFKSAQVVVCADRRPVGPIRGRGHARAVDRAHEYDLDL